MGFVVVFFTHSRIFEGIYIFYLVIRNMLLLASMNSESSRKRLPCKSARVRLGFCKARGKEKHGGLGDPGIIWNLGEGGKDSKEGLEGQKNSQVP